MSKSRLKRMKSPVKDMNWHEEILHSFPPLVRNRARLLLDRYAASQGKWKDGIPVGWSSSLNSDAEFIQMMQLELETIPGVGYKRASQLIRSGRARTFSAKHWMAMVKLIRENPEALQAQSTETWKFHSAVTSRPSSGAALRITFSGKSTNQTLYPKKTIRTLREWVASWDDPQEAGDV